MKTKGICILAAIAAMPATFPASAQTPLGSAFTYQGQLKSGGIPTTDTADFEFSLWDDPGTCPPVGPPAGGTQIGVTQTVSGVTVTDGLFTVEVNAGGEFEASAFDGDARWLQIAVRSPAGGGAFTALCPRQPLTAAPYALKTRGVDGHSLDAADGSPTDVVFVDNSGNVGIGTPTPSNRLSVAGDADFTGRVGIGTAGPSAGLHVLSNVQYDTARVESSFVDGTYFRLVNTSAGGRNWVVDSTGATSGEGPGHLMFLDDTASAVRAIITSAGNVGIGTTAPAQQLHVAANARVDGTLYASTVSSNSPLQLQTAGTTRIFVNDTTGFVGFGTTTPTAKLHVAGTAGVDGIRFPDGRLQTTAFAQPTVHNRIASHGSAQTIDVLSGWADIADSVETVNLPQGMAVITWSLSASASPAHAGEFRPNLGGVVPGTATKFFFTADTHMTVSGSFAAQVSAGATQIKLQGRTTAGQGPEIAVDGNDHISWTVTVYPN